MTPAPPRVTVLVADDDTKVRQALVALVSSQESLQLVGAAADAQEAIELARRHRPDVAVIDVEMPRGGGARAVTEVLWHSPRTRVIALSGFADRERVMEMLDNGAIGYMVKSASLDLLAGIATASRGEGSPSFRTADAMMGPADRGPAEPVTEASRPGERDFRVVIDERHFHIAFQPVIDLGRRTVLGVEALARFSPDPRQTPDLWFADASAFGLDEDLELAVVSMALDAASLCPADMFLAINLSPAVAMSERLHDRVREAKDLSLVLEVSDRALTPDVGALATALARLRDHGARFAIDDAGSGAHGFGHFEELMPDMIKIDAAVVAQIGHDQAGVAMAAEIVGVAEALGATVVGEGIETAAQREHLMALGVRCGQGFLLGRPGPLPLDPRVTMA